MTTLEQYYNQHILPQTQGFDKSVCVSFEQLTDEQKKAFESTLNYQFFALNQSWQNLKTAILKAIGL